MQTRFSAIALCAVAAAALALASCATGKEVTPSSSPPTVIATPPPSSTSGTPVPAPLGQAVMTPVVGSVLAPPIAVPGTDGRVHLAYELQLINTLAQEVTLTSVAAVAGDKTLLTLSGDGLAYWTQVLGSTTPTAKLGPAQTAAVVARRRGRRGRRRSDGHHSHHRPDRAAAAAAAGSGGADREHRADESGHQKARDDLAAGERTQLARRQQLL